ncbi:Hypothetical predicted protein [Lecanosticta acicola]|uniref:25S rRNA (Uridine(2843)-N(3))-methyltransferase n=1 Tax=Lecanosticta acicola TaxID=111012 RepID=A0AAI9EDN7_9PEZI|nr:Hypothetical predicted protein [Lecanosticta acicola]
MAKGKTTSVPAKSRPKSKTAKGSPAETAPGGALKLPTRTVTLDLQQKCLNIFRDTFRPGEDDTALLQEVKGHLYNRDFAAAFGKEDYLRVYASRWSPSRALGYLQVLTDIHEHISANTEATCSEAEKKDRFKAVCIGGGAGAEVVALAGWTRLAEGQTSDRQVKSIDCRLLDIADWNTVVEDLQKAVTTPPELSKYASAAAKETNVALLAGNAFRAEFHQTDALNMAEDQCQELFVNVDLVTLMFTLNELYSTSVPKTQQMLAEITNNIRPGARLLVVDSSGSYSTVSLDGAEKKYPMQWLLDYTLIGTAQSGARGTPQWEKLVSDESRWFRLPQGLNYPIELENMRYQIHLYRRLTDTQPG